MADDAKNIAQAAASGLIMLNGIMDLILAFNETFPADPITPDNLGPKLAARQAENDALAARVDAT